MPTKLGHELERAELSVLVVGQDEHDVGSWVGIWVRSPAGINDEPFTLFQSKRIDAGLLHQGCITLALPSGLVYQLCIWRLTWAGKATACATRPPLVVQFKKRNFFREQAPGCWPGGEEKDEEGQGDHGRNIITELRFLINQSVTWPYKVDLGEFLALVDSLSTRDARRTGETCSVMEVSQICKRKRRGHNNTDISRQSSWSRTWKRTENLGLFICVLGSRGLGHRGNSWNWKTTST